MPHLPPFIAAIAFVIGILGLFYLDRGGHARTSKALWIPAIWLFITCSRPLSLWLGMSAASADAAEAYVEGSPIDRAVFMVLLFAALPVVIARIDRVGPLLGKSGAILLYISYCAMSIFWSDFPLVSFKRWIKLVEVTMMVLVILTESDPLGAVKRLVTRLGFLLFPLSVLFAKYYPNLGRRLTNSWTEEITGVATQKNGLGIICMIYGVGFLWMLATVYRDRADPTRRRRLWAYGAILLMIVWLLWNCMSMTSIVGLAMAAGVMFLSTRPSLVRKRAVVHLLVFTAIGVSLFSMFFLPAVLEAFGKDPNLSGRYLIWSLVLSIHINPWIGTGFESFWLGDRLLELRDAMPNFPINEAHNGFIEVYLNLGWIGVSLIGFLLVATYRKVIAMFRQDPGVGSLFLGFFLGLVFESFTEAAFRNTAPSWMFLVLTSIAASQVIAVKAVAQPGNESAEGAQRIGAVGSAIVGMGR